MTHVHAGSYLPGVDTHEGLGVIIQLAFGVHALGVHALHEPQSHTTSVTASGLQTEWMRTELIVEFGGGYAVACDRVAFAPRSPPTLSCTPLVSQRVDCRRNGCEPS